MAFPRGKPRPPDSGRKRGTPNKVTRELREMVLAALDKAGGETYLLAQARAEPASFLALLGKCLPKDVNLKGSGVLKVRIVDPTRRDRQPTLTRKDSASGRGCVKT